MSIYEYDQEKHLRQVKLLDDLYGLLAKSGRIDDILRATKEPEYRDKLLQEFLGRKWLQTNIECKNFKKEEERSCCVKLWMRQLLYNIHILKRTFNGV